jgi:hypothetical protein
MRYHDYRRPQQEGGYPGAHAQLKAQIEETSSELCHEKLQDGSPNVWGGIAWVPVVPKTQEPAMPGGGGGGMGGMNF